jgi:hypothetical protein
MLQVWGGVEGLHQPAATPSDVSGRREDT